MLPRFTRRPVDRYMLRFTFACRSDEIPLSLRGMLEMHDYLCLLDNAPTMPWYGAPQYTPESPLFHEGAHPLPAPVLFQDKTTPEDICDAIYMHFLAAGRIEYGVDARRMAIAQGVPRYVANKRYKMFCARYAGLAVT